MAGSCLSPDVAGILKGQGSAAIENMGVFPVRRSWKRLPPYAKEPFSRKVFMLVAANWKMHGDAAMIEAYARDLPLAAGVRRVVCPPFIYLESCRRAFAGHDVFLGGQDCHARVSGAHTGDVAAAMLADVGAEYVIVGHSERRQAYQESHDQVVAKMMAAFAAGITPIVCVGEHLADREAGRAWDVVSASLQPVFAAYTEAATSLPLVLAYEPIWAIGTGVVASAEAIADMHGRIHQMAKEAGIAGLVLLYGGSVKPDNAAGIAAIDGVDGFLVGGASLRPQDFHSIALSVASAAKHYENRKPKARFSAAEQA